MAEQHPQQRQDRNYRHQLLLERLLLQRQLQGRGPRRFAFMERDGDPPVAVMFNATIMVGSQPRE